MLYRPQGYGRPSASFYEWKSFGSFIINHFSLCENEYPDFSWMLFLARFRREILSFWRPSWNKNISSDLFGISWLAFDILSLLSWLLASRIVKQIFTGSVSSISFIQCQYEGRFGFEILYLMNLCKTLSWCWVSKHTRKLIWDYVELRSQQRQIEKCIRLHLKHTFSTLRNIFFAVLVTKVNALEHELWYQSR